MQIKLFICFTQDSCNSNSIYQIKNNNLKHKRYHWYPLSIFIPEKISSQILHRKNPILLPTKHDPIITLYLRSKSYMYLITFFPSERLLNKNIDKILEDFLPSGGQSRMLYMRTFYYTISQKAKHISFLNTNEALMWTKKGILYYFPFFHSTYSRLVNSIELLLL